VWFKTLLSQLTSSYLKALVAMSYSFCSAVMQRVPEKKNTEIGLVFVKDK
jgi:hypothetical protein